LSDFHIGLLDLIEVESGLLAQAGDRARRQASGCGLAFEIAIDTRSKCSGYEVIATKFGGEFHIIMMALPSQ